MSGASNHRGNSEQDVQTPRDLLDAVEGRFGLLTFDLAAHAGNTVAHDYFTKDNNALTIDWPVGEHMWLNPPFSNIAPWAAKCEAWLLSNPHPCALLLLLVPASVDSNWWRDHVAGKARVLALNPRIRFVGHTQGFPKPLALCVYDPRFPHQPALVESWRWRP